MISVSQAISFAQRHFPDGPEKLAVHLGVLIRYGPLSGCDGWCLTVGKRTVIRVNSNATPTRQRFTLAHELGHLLLGIPSVVGESIFDFLNSDDREEQRVNDVAAELLLPSTEIRAVITDLPVVAATLRKIAKRANASELAVALRVANLAEELGLVNAAVVFFGQGDEVKWQFSRTLTMSDATAQSICARARDAAPHPFRLEREQGDVVVASLIENPYFGTATMFVQLLPADVGKRLCRDERLKELAEDLFAGEPQFQRQLQGCFGAFKPKTVGMSLADAVAAFWKRYGERWKGVPKARLKSPSGQEYVRLRLEEWCS